MKNNRWIMMLMALIAGFLIISTVPATVFAEESEGIFEIGDDYTGAYDEDYSNDWWYDTYSNEEEISDDVFGYYGDEDDWSWYDNDYYDGYHDDTWDDNDWYFDTYDDAGDEGFWDF